VAPLEVSNVCSETRNWQGTPEVRVAEITALSSPRLPENPALVKGRLTDEVTPLATVNVVAVPMVAPAVLTKDTVPVQEAAVPLDDALAKLVRSSRAVSVLPNPKGGRD